MHECRFKNSFDHEPQAQAAARRNEKKHGWRMRWYTCNQCGLYHLARDKHNGLPILLLEYLQTARETETT